MKCIKQTQRQILSYCVKILFLSALFSCPDQSRAQIFYAESGTFTDTSTLHQYFREAVEVFDSLKRWKGNFKMHLLDVNGKKYLTVDGLFNVYEWKEGQWVNLCNENLGGYNYHSKKFVWNNEIYSFGGYGYWKHHGELIRFRWDKNEWEMVAYGDSDPIGSGLVYLYNEKLNVIDPVAFTYPYLTLKKYSPSFSIDMKTLETEDLDIELPINFHVRPNTLSVETQNYIVLMFSPYYLIDKKNAEVYTTEFINYRCYNLKEDVILYAKNDSLIMMDRSMKRICSQDIHFLVKDKYIPASRDKSEITTIMLGFGLLTTILLGFTLYFRRRARKTSDLHNIHNTYEDPRIGELLEYSGVK